MEKKEVTKKSESREEFRFPTLFLLSECSLYFQEFSGIKNDNASVKRQTLAVPQ